MQDIRLCKQVLEMCFKLIETQNKPRKDQKMQKGLSPQFDKIKKDRAALPKQKMILYINRFQNVV